MSSEAQMCIPSSQPAQTLLLVSVCALAGIPLSAKANVLRIVFSNNVVVVNGPAREVSWAPVSDAYSVLKAGENSMPLSWTKPSSRTCTTPVEGSKRYMCLGSLGFARKFWIKPYSGSVNQRSPISWCCFTSSRRSSR